MDKIKRRSTAFVEDTVPSWNDQEFKGYLHISRATYLLPTFLYRSRFVPVGASQLVLDDFFR